MQIKNMTRPLAVKSLAADGVFCGYASVFGTLDHQNEIVAKGAFRRTLFKWRSDNAAPAMLWMHDPSQPIGLWMDMREDDKGLAVQGKLALMTQKGREAYELLKLGALTGLSIGYRIVSSRIDKQRMARILTDVDLFEISLVTFPANESARVGGVKAPMREGFGKEQQDADIRAIVARLNRASRTLVESDNITTRRTI